MTEQSKTGTAKRIEGILEITFYEDKPEWCWAIFDLRNVNKYGHRLHLHSQTETVDLDYYEVIKAACAYAEKRNIWIYSIFVEGIENFQSQKGDKA